MILYIHGFGSSGESFKAKLVKEYFKKEGILAPSLSYIPDLAIGTLKDIIEFFKNKKERVFLMGSSLGGFYAMYLSEIYSLKAVLINPAVNAPETLKKAIPKAVSYYDGSHFEWNENHIKMLQKYAVTPAFQKDILLMLQKGDDVLDYREALEKLKDANLILEDGGSHHFEGFKNHFKTIEEFFGIEAQNE